MIPFYADDWLQVYDGDAAEVLADLPPASVHTVITSPPYFGLRDYGHDGQLGMESSPEEYVEHLVEISRGIRHVLRPDGIYWLNLGDSYSSGSRTSTTLQTLRSKQVMDNKRRSKQSDIETVTAATAVRPPRSPMVKPKDLFGIPWLVAFALRADGWYLRRDIIWSKPNPMPESVEDRCTSSHEYIFMLTKSPDYFYDSYAIKEPVSDDMQKALMNGIRPLREYQHDEATRFGKTSGNRVFSDFESMSRIVAAGRNKRSVWSIPTVAYPGAHFATFPPKLVEPMILASTSEQGCCAECGAPYRRSVESVTLSHHDTYRDGKTMDGPYAAQAAVRSGTYVDTRTTGWKPSCKHDVELAPCVVLDPFAGSGTVGMVAAKLSRKAVMIDINPDYLRQQIKRNQQVPLGL